MAKQLHVGKMLLVQTKDCGRSAPLRMESESRKYVFQDDPVVDVFSTMERLGLHELPIRNRNDKVVGMVFRRHPLVPGTELTRPLKHHSVDFGLKSA